MEGKVQEQVSHSPSTFLTRGLYAQSNTLASLHLKRDLQYPILLQEKDEKNEGYDEGKVTNTRFGSFPHSTLIGLPWGSQIRASAVDTGSRGRRGPDGKANQGQKRKRGTDNHDTSRQQVIEDSAHKAAKEASTGFAHLLAPTPESWTGSLPHRTQVVYTPDYSYILQRLRVRPGSVIIEAGAGSGSFTHAAVRAVYNGTKSTNPGKVYSFEFHDHRVRSLREEILSHGLDPIVHITHRDVYEDGFQISSLDSASNNDQPVVQANAIFLDLPAPWLALPHLTRQGTSKSSSPLSTKSTTRICTFSPCIEQVQRTIIALRAHGWLEIEMVEIAAKRIEVRRERIGLQEEGLRGVNVTPISVEESLSKLRELEKRAQLVQVQANTRDRALSETERIQAEREEREKAGIVTKQQRLQSIKDAQAERKLFREGRLVHRVEPDIKTHTSYLVFALLPRSWTEEDEEKATTEIHHLEQSKKGKSKRQMKREARAARAGESE